ncbi:unnamed protein product [Strongylus vulgaris]|uniref:Serine-threonine protein phosphatase N-terminal domain-containing protein n=1 Tax=Strongylus vulgaris TaxID=40348 RepID=A0A3P7JPP1_STRVU|nr:unnamed protein product [Strongylus vulgaris]
MASLSLAVQLVKFLKINRKTSADVLLFVTPIDLLAMFTVLLGFYSKSCFENMLWKTLVFHTHCATVRGSKPGKNVQLTENEIKGLCIKSREIFLSQPILLELEAPLKICDSTSWNWLTFSLLKRRLRYLIKEKLQSSPLTSDCCFHPTPLSRCNVIDRSPLKSNYNFWLLVPKLKQ